MKSRTTDRFRRAFAELPEQVKQQTREAYRQFKQDPSHPSLRFKKIHPELPIYAARISKSYRAVGRQTEIPLFGFGWVRTQSTIDYSLSCNEKCGGDRKFTAGLVDEIGNDTIIGSQSNDSFIGGAGKDKLTSRFVIRTTSYNSLF